MFTFHGYGTWWPDHPSGYVRKGGGVLPSDPEMGERYRDSAKFDPVRFDRKKQQVIVEAIREVCERLGVRLHYVVTVSTHAHAVVSWTGGYTWDEVHDRIKRICGLKLARLMKTKGRRWFSEGRDSNRVKDRGHFEHLMTKYLPDHHGVTWNERKPSSS
jgi:hypothetical protein